MASTFPGVVDGPSFSFWSQVNTQDFFQVGLASSDFNGDGINDILFRNSPFAFSNPGLVAIWNLNSASIIDGGFLPNVPRGTDSPSAWRIVASYGDNDSYNLFGTYNGINFAPFGFEAGYPVPKLDFDGNGTSDIFWRKNNGTEIAIWNIQGGKIINGAFLQGAPDSSGGFWNDWQPFPGDFNGDGKTDVYWENSFDGRKAIWIMDGPNIIGGGFLQNSPRPEQGWFNWDNDFADFNGDGKTDLIWRNDDTAEIAIWIMDGPGIVNGGFLPDSPSGADPFFDWSFEYGDFNGDGKTDLFWENNFSGEKAIWVMDGPNVIDGGFLQNSPRPEQGWFNWDFNFGDFNGDGKTDVAWRNFNTGESAIWIMDGPNIVNGGFAPPSPDGTDPLGWQPYFGDFNGDGKTDVYWNNNSKDYSAIWILDGPNIVNGAYLQDVPILGQSGWYFDFREINGDGKTDIYWTNELTGNKAAWLMDGPNIVGGGFLPQNNPTG
jgi:hypothetical protein